jgi:SWI/SNF-related matrix-associated actin-dependent regulator of chromatin subfamily A-like protein 1
MRNSITFDYTPRLKPLPHQIEATNFLVERDSAALFDEQGLGKTKIVIDALARLFTAHKIEGAIIICKKSLLKNWEQEIQKHSNLRSITLRGTPHQKGIRFMWFAHFYLINYDLIASEVDRLKKFLETRPMAIVLDESQRIKNPKSKATRAIHDLAPLARRRFIITGTPIANTPEDIWAQAYFLDSGLSVGRTLQEFREKFPFQSKLHMQHTIDRVSLTQLREALSAFSMRRTKEAVLELPEKIYRTHEVDLERSQREMYDKVREQLYLEITSLDGAAIIDNVENILKRMLRLVEIASNPRLLDASYATTPAKFSAADTIIAEIMARNEKVIIWTNFVDNIRSLRRRYDAYGTSVIFGDIPIDTRAEIVSRFQSSADLRILIANPASAREGLTLTAANHAIYIDRNFNLVDYLQSQDRIHRISQERPAYIHNLVGKNTIDVYIEDVVYRKQAIAGFLYGDSEDLDLPPPTFDREDLLRLLGN